MSRALTPIGHVFSTEERGVSSVEELLDAVRDSAVKTITVANDLSEVPAIRLAAGVALRGVKNLQPKLRFVPDTDGVCFSTNNVVADLDLLASDDRCAICNDESVNSLGRLTIHCVNTTGRVRILARSNVRQGHVVVETLDIVSADARGEQDRPHEYGVDVLQGAFTFRPAGWARRSWAVEFL
jgi:hypothetical protein